MREAAASLRAKLLLAIAPSAAILVPVIGCSPSQTNVATSEADGATSGGATSGGATSAVSAASTATTSKPPVSATPVASYGAVPCASPQEQCFTHDQLVNLLRHPPQGGAIDPPESDVRHVMFQPQRPDPAASAPWDKDGCLPAKLVENGCCNPASAGPVLKADKCCYQFCEGACCGRPLVVDGVARVSALRARSDWRLAGGAATAGSVDPVTRAAIARAWIDDARMEHASVASFGRFTLELLAVGAPASLVSAAQRAALDEVRHAQMCFEIAARVGAEEVGPDAMDLGGAGVASRLVDVVAAVVREGCVGETIAALLAREAATGTADPMVRAALDRIAEDEARHAELAWRVLRWAIDTGGDDVRAAATRSLDDALSSVGLPAPAPDGVDEDAWRRLGRLTCRDARAVATAAIREVILPVFAAC